MSRKVSPFEEHVSTDLSEKFERAKNKVMFVGSFSALVGLFDLSGKAKLFGITLSGLTDRRLEWVLWVTLVFFALNMAFRFFDERKTLQLMRKNASQLKKYLEKEIEQLVGTIGQLEDVLGNQARYGHTIKYFAQRVENINDGMNRLELPKGQSLQEFVKQLNIELPNIKAEVRHAISSNEATLKRIEEEFSPTIEELRKNLRMTKSFRNIGGLRVMIFDILIPISLVFFATALHFFPGFVQFVLVVFPKGSSGL